MALYNAGLPDAKDFSTDLKELNSNRRDADYKLALRFNLGDGQAALNLARHAIATFDALDKAALREGVEDYLRKTNQI
jgi:hypothetical protein